LTGVSQAKVGELFIHRGPGLKCGGCKYFDVCAKNLEIGRIYKIVNLRDKILTCEMHNIEMRVVEVVEAEVEAAINPKQAIEGIIFTFHPQICNRQDCENISICLPEALRDGDRCRVVNIYGALKCPRDLQLARVLLMRVPPSS